MIALTTRQTRAIKVGVDRLDALLAIPDNASGLVVLVHDEEEGRFNPKAARIANRFHKSGLATLLVDLLHPDEALKSANWSDTAFLAARLFSVAEWATSSIRTAHLPLGYCGAGSGAAASLTAASGPDRRIRAIVIRGSRFDFAHMPALSRIRAPLMMVAGGRDLPAIGLGHVTQSRLACEHELIIIPGASPRFDEEDKLDEAITHAERWFIAHLRKPAAHS